MIRDRDRFVCPADGGPVDWPEARCRKCGETYALDAVPGLRNAGARFELYDFRPVTPDIQGDRHNLEVHRATVADLLRVEGGRLRDLGFEDLRAGLGRWDARTPGAAAWATYALQTVRNLAEWGWHAVSGRVTKMAAGADSVRSSFAGYSRAHEMISDFARPDWFGWYRGRLGRAPAILHHHRNMLRLSEWLRAWGGRDVLEFGCGTGVNLLLLGRACPGGEALRLSGFDYALSRIFSARATIEHFGLDCRNLFLGNGLALPLAPESFDVVFSHYAVEQLRGFEEVALDNMLRVARTGVILFETAVHRPTFDQRVYMRHSGYSRRLPEVVARRTDVIVERMENVLEDRFFGAPNVAFVLRKHR